MTHLHAYIYIYLHIWISDKTTKKQVYPVSYAIIRYLLNNIWYSLHSSTLIGPASNLPRYVFKLSSYFILSHPSPRHAPTRCALLRWRCHVMSCPVHRYCQLALKEHIGDILGPFPRRKTKTQWPPLRQRIRKTRLGNASPWERDCRSLPIPLRLWSILSGIHFRLPILPLPILYRPTNMLFEISSYELWTQSVCFPGPGWNEKTQYPRLPRMTFLLNISADSPNALQMASVLVSLMDKACSGADRTTGSAPSILTAFGIMGKGDR